MMKSGGNLLTPLVSNHLRHANIFASFGKGESEKSAGHSGG